MNRVKNRNYSDNVTPNVAYTYDNLPNAKGKLIKVNSSVSTTEYTSFDILGRVQNHKQTTDGNAYNSSYVYNLSVALIEEVYPSGRVVKNTLDVDGDLALVQSSKSNVQGLKMYANAFTYTSAGAVSSLRLGNGKFENTTFNSRLQPIQIGLGSSATSQNLLKLNFDYGLADNNGNVKSQTITTPTIGTNQGFVATQNYAYDSLNRLKSAVETIPNHTGWKQTFKFDRYGNRTFDTTNNNTTTLANGCPINICNPTANPNDNKLVGTNYDSVGNTSQDANGQTFVYDAENKQVQVNNAGGIVGQYWYNGDGQRVKKYVPSTQETTIFVYDAAGKTVAEYSTIVANQTNAKINYTTTDHLGSPRINTDANGNVIARHDTMPFGEEIQRANYGTDNLRNRFTSYERDGETGLDYAKARMFGSGLGRFTSPDPSLKISLIEPQSWNKYVYAFNNPQKFVDKDGRWPTSIHNLILKLAFPNLTAYQIENMQVGSLSVDVPWTMFETYANQHAMRKPSQTADEAKSGMDAFISEKNDLAKKNNSGDDIPSRESLYNFGQSSHPIMDNTSPTHSPFQEFDNSNMFLCVINPYSFYLFRKEIKEHSDGESKITPAQLNQAISDVRENYRNVYGEKALRNAIGDFSSSRYVFSRRILNGNSKPKAIDVGDLGIVTVYPDGREDYKGPLKRTK